MRAVWVVAIGVLACAALSSALPLNFKCVKSCDNGNEVVGPQGVAGDYNPGHVNEHRQVFDGEGNLYVWGGSSDIGGQNLAAQGSYGSKNFPSGGNWPGARAGFGFVINAAKTKIYLLAGYGNAQSETSVAMNDVWCFDIATQTWSWLAGSNERGPPVPALVTANNEFSAQNTPGGTTFASAVITSTNVIYMFGGALKDNQGLFTVTNQMWKYDIASGQWAFASGCIGGCPASFGTKNVEAATNVPAARGNAGLVINSANKIFLFGGTKEPRFSENGALSDLWSYNIATEAWTWLYGDSDMHTGSKTVPASMHSFAMAISSTSVIYIYGGTNTAEGSDWEYLGARWTVDVSNTANIEWKYHGGDVARKFTRPPATEGQVPGEPGNVCNAQWSFNSAGELFLFGGVAYGKTSGNVDKLSILWQFGEFECPGGCPDPNAGDGSTGDAGSSTGQSAAPVSAGVSAAAVAVTLTAAVLLTAFA